MHTILSNKTRLLLILFWAFILFSCKKSEINSLPEIAAQPQYTCTGENTCSFIVKNRLVIAKDYVERKAGVYSSVIDFNDFLGKKVTLNFLGELVKENYYESVNFTIENFIDTGYYYFNSNVPFPLINTCTYRIGTSRTITKFYDVSPVNFGYVHVMKFDTLNQIIAGSFDFSAELYLGQEKDTIHVRNGLFDCRYIIQ